MVKPNFLVIGAQKSGTTSVCHSLSLHPDVFMSQPKELDFFSLDETYRRGFDWYCRLFEAGQGRKAIGEGSPSYTMKLLRPHAAARIAKRLPDTRLIYIVRHPLQRIESAWRHLHLSNRFRGELEVALKDFPHLLDTSLYWEQINTYRQYYDDDQILVLFFEDFVAAPSVILKEVFQFLEVDAEVEIDQAKEPKGSSVGKSVANPLLVKLRQSQWLMQAAQWAPVAPRRFIASLLSEPLQYEPKWTDQSRYEVLDKIISDASKFLDFYGKPESFWNFDVNEC